MLPLLALAVLVPPHGRVNTQCYTAWNADKTNLEVIWNGQRYAQPWTFNTEVGTELSTCSDDACVQRLWCTDSGAAGRYTVNASRKDDDTSLVLAYTWLLNTSLKGERPLEIQSADEPPVIMRHTSSGGPGTVLVMGNTLYFYAYDYVRSTEAKYGLPRLSSLVFAEYQPGKTADELVTPQLAAFNVLGYAGAFSWRALSSPLYAAGRAALTVSVEDALNGNYWAVDASLRVRSGSAERTALVHAAYVDFPAIASVSRDVLTVPAFACRAFLNGSAPLCHRTGVSGERYTWSARPETALGWTFAPLRELPSFALPSDLWLHRGEARHEFRFPLVATHGLGQILAFDNSSFFGVALRPQAGCAGGALFLISCDVSGAAPVQRAATPLGCAAEQAFPESVFVAVPYEAAAFKWLGPVGDTAVLLTAQNVSAHQYSATTWSALCPAGSYRAGAACLACPVGSYCPGPLDRTEERRTCPPLSHAPRQGMARCAVPPGFVFAYPGSVQVCPADRYCPGGLSDSIACPADRPHSAPGCRRPEQCRS